MNSNTTVKELIESQKYGEFADYFWTYITNDHLDAPLSAYGYEACDFEFALKRIEELAASGKEYIYPVYSRQEIYEDHELSEAKLIFFPAMEMLRDGYSKGLDMVSGNITSCEDSVTKEMQECGLSFNDNNRTPLSIQTSDGRSNSSTPLSTLTSDVKSINSAPLSMTTCIDGPDTNPFALVIPGGGFARQWTLIEGFAIAARLNEMGIPAFVLLYRTAKKGVLSMAIEDMHRAIRYIIDNAEQFNVSSSSYIMGGFSAGATLAASMATDNLGWKASSLPKPEMIFLGYLAQKLDLFYDAWANSEDEAEKKSIQAFLSRITDGEITKDALNEFIIENHISKETCPPLFFTANHDDPVVSFEHSYSLYQKATSLGIKTVCRFGEIGGHSYGIGTGLEVDGWLKDAISFWHPSVANTLDK